MLLRASSIAFFLLPLASPLATATVGVVPGNLTVALESVLHTGADTPMDLISHGDGLLHISTINGKILTYDPTTACLTVFLDMGVGGANLPLPAVGGANGYYGFAFHPDFNDSAKAGYHKIYTWGDELKTTGTGAKPPLTGLPDFWHPEQYTAGTPTPTVSNYGKATFGIFNVLREWTVDASVSPAVVAPGSSRVILRLADPAVNGHNGSPPRFGPDGYLYLTVGDGGGSGNDHSGGINSNTDGHTNTTGNAQDLTNIFGKVFRIDPIPSDPGGILSTNGQYRIPSSNPYSNGASGRVREIYANGFRNPWKFTFDDRPGGTGALLLSNVGSHHREEIELIVNGGNYGWGYYEGTVPLINQDNYSGDVLSANVTRVRTPPGNFTFIPPLAEYKTRRQYAPDGATATSANLTGDGTAVTGGYVYRGSASPVLSGQYIFGDYSIAGTPPAGLTANRGRLFYLDPAQSGPQIFEFQSPTASPLPAQLLGFGQDDSGELYVLFDNGEIDHLLGPPPAPLIDTFAGDSGDSPFDHLTSDPTPTLFGTKLPATDIQIFRNGAAVGAITGNPTGNWTFTESSPLTDGAYSYSATAGNAAGNSTASANFTIVIDQSPPPAPTILSISDNSLPALTGNAEANSLVTLALDGIGIIGNITAGSSGNWSFTYNGTALPDFIYTFTATARDAAGNSGADSSPFTVLIGPAAAYHTWAAQTIPNSAQRAPHDNPSGDGISNLLKFALGLDPLANRIGADEGRSVKVTDSGQIYPAIVYTRRLASGLGAVTVSVVASDEPGFSNSLGTVEVSAVPNGDDLTETVTIRSSTPLSTKPRQFLRITVALP